MAEIQTVQQFKEVFELIVEKAGWSSKFLVLLSDQHPELYQGYQRKKVVAEGVINEAMARIKMKEDPEATYYRFKVKVELELKFIEGPNGVKAAGGVESWATSEFGIGTMDIQLDNGMADSGFVEAITNDIKKQIADGKAKVVSIEKEHY